MTPARVRVVRFGLLPVFALLAFAVMPQITHAAEGVDWTEATTAANWPARYAGGVTTFNNELWMMGGYTGSSYYNDVWSSTDGINWTEATSSAGWSGRNSFGTLVFNNKLWIIGGLNGSTYYNDVWYSSDGINWTRATSNAGWTGRANPGVTVYDGKMWVMGGSTGPSTAVNDVWYSSDGVTWTEETASAGWTPRLGPGVLTYDNRMWLIGGVGILVPFTSDVWYSTDGASWTEATTSAAWTSRYNMGANVFDGKMWIVGGNNGMNLSDVWNSTDGINWTETASSPGWTARQLSGAPVFNNKLWVYGGLTNSNDVWYTAQNTYTLSFNSEGGSSVSSDTLSASATTTVPAAPTQSGYTFAHWNTAADDSGTVYAPGDTYTMPASNTTLYAIWQAQAPTPTPTATNTGGSSGGGTSITQQVANLISMGKTALARQIESQWPQLFPIAPASTSTLGVPFIVSAPFTQDLHLGVTGSDVQKLQQFLNTHGFPIAKTGVGSGSQETTYFGALTKAALAAYQKANGITPASGYFGPITRAYIAAHS